MRHLLIAVMLLAGMTACTDEQPSSEEILGYIRASNLDSTKSPWQASVANGQLKRWDIATAPIPVKLNGSTLAAEAMDQIESTLGLTVFDRTSIASTPDSAIARGIILSQGTATGPDSHGSCGSVTNPPSFYDSSGTISGKFILNLSSTACNASLDVAIHEFGHALGLGQHFKDFGDGDSISQNFWDTLFTIYHNNIGAPESQIVVTLGARRVP